MKDDHTVIEQQLKAVYEKVDQSTVQTPELTYFTALILQQENLRMRKQNLQFSVFASCAFFIVVLLIFSLVAYTFVFIIMQIIAAMVSVFWVAYYLLARKERVE